MTKSALGPRSCGCPSLPSRVGDMVRHPRADRPRPDGVLLVRAACDGDAKSPLLDPEVDRLGRLPIPWAARTAADASASERAYPHRAVTSCATNTSEGKDSLGGLPLPARTGLGLVRTEVYESAFRSGPVPGLGGTLFLNRGQECLLTMRQFPRN